MSAILRNTGPVASSETRQAILRSNLNSTVQWSQGVSANPKTVVVGGGTIVDIKLGSKDPEVELSHWWKYERKNTHATASITCKRGCLNDWDEVIISTNDSTDRAVNITGKHALSTMRSIISDYFLNLGINIYEDTSFIRNELTTFNGSTLTAGSTAIAYYPLDPFISFARTQLQGEIKSLRLEFRATANPSSIADHGVLCTSSTTANVWGSMQFNDIRYVRNYVITKNPALRSGFLSGMDPKVPIKHTQWKVEDVLLYTGVWDDSVHVNTKLSDVYKSSKIQMLLPYVRPTAQAYNSTTCEQEYSGYQNILWKTRELNNGDEKTVDMSDARLLRDHEIKQYRNMYGKQHLPIELFGATDTDFKKYFLRMSCINFDYLAEDLGHEVIKSISSLSNDWELDFYGANATALNGGDPCQLRCAVVYLEEYDYIRSGAPMGQVVKVA
jgi:hypothetical protein